MRRARSSLPNPPAGQQWIRVDGDWQLVSTVEATAVDEAPHGARDGLEALTVECCDAVTPADGSPPTIDLTPPPPPREHVVLPGDTLQGLCLRYKTTARKLKKVNPSLDVGNSSLRGVAALRIPGTGPAQPATAEVEIARVRAAVPALSTAEARFYLSVDATVEAAVAHARADAAWERGQGDWVPPVLSPRGGPRRRCGAGERRGVYPASQPARIPASHAGHRRPYGRRGRRRGGAGGGEFSGSLLNTSRPVL